MSAVEKPFIFNRVSSVDTSQRVDRLGSNGRSEGGDHVRIPRKKSLVTEVPQPGGVSSSDRRFIEDEI
jgi:hypothetical protein